MATSTNILRSLPRMQKLFTDKAAVLTEHPHEHVCAGDMVDYALSLAILAREVRLLRDRCDALEAAASRRR